MVAPVIAGSLIQAGTSLLGGLLGNRQRKKDAYNNSPQGIRANAEAAGFNPLVFAGPGTGTGANYAPVMGAYIADAGSAFGEGIAANEQLKMQKSELELENQRLEQLAKATKLAANVPGIYGSRQGDSPSGGRPGGSHEEPLLNFGAIGDAERTMEFAGWKVHPNPGFSPAQKIEDEYAEIISLPYGAAKLASDTGWNIGLRIGAARLLSKMGRYRVEKALQEKYPAEEYPDEKARHRAFMRDFYPTVFDQ